MKIKRSETVYQGVVKAIATHVGYNGVIKALREVVRERDDIDSDVKDRLDKIFNAAIDGIENGTKMGVG